MRTKQEGADIVLLYMHAGGQYNAQPTEYTKELTGWLLKNGVDIVVGSHEHVVHGGNFSKISQGKLAAYSLGNFDGIAGVYAKPMDKMAEYSIAWHIYLEKQGEKVIIMKHGFSILKCIEAENRQVRTVPCYDLYKKIDDPLQKEALWKDMQVIAKKFGNIDIDQIKEEYYI